MSIIQASRQTESNISASTPIKNLIILGGEKDGVGTNFVTCNLIGYFIRKGWLDKMTVFDANPSVDEVYQVFSTQPWMKKAVFSSDKFRAKQGTIVFEENKPIVVITLPSNINKEFNNFCENHGIFEERLQQEIYETCYFFFVSDGSCQSIKLFQEHLEQYKDKLFIKTILLLNQQTNGYSETFDYLGNLNSSLSINLIKEINEYQIPLLIIPELCPDIKLIVDSLLINKRINFEEIITSNKLDKNDRQSYEFYLQKMDNLFNNLFNDEGEIDYEGLQQKQADKRSDTSLPI